MKKITLDYVDHLSGRQFEFFTGHLVKLLKFTNITVTQATGDYGLDVLATNTHGFKVGIQCKHLNINKNIGYRAIEEANSGQNYYNTSYTVVLTNRYFSKNAIKGAKRTHVILWDRDSLLHLIKLANKNQLINKMEKKYSNARIHMYESVRLKVLEHITGMRSMSELLDDMIKIVKPIYINTPSKQKEAEKSFKYNALKTIFRVY